MTKQVDVIDGQLVKFDAWPTHINPKAHKIWAGKVTHIDKEKKYDIQLEWLDKDYIENVIHYDISELMPGDIVKVNAGSHKNKYPVYFKIMNITQKEMEVVKLTKQEVRSSFEDKEEKEIRKLQREIMNKIFMIKDIKRLKEINKNIELK